MAATTRPSFSFVTRISSRCRRLRVEVHPGGQVEVVVPPGTSPGVIAEFVSSHDAWVERQLARLARLPMWQVERALTEPEGRAEARWRLEMLLPCEAMRLGVRYKRIEVRDQRSRWGSCSHRGTLSFSWRLALAPEGILEYVAIHELCHLRQWNHSAAFWELVEAARPGYRSERNWLRDYGHALLTYVPPAVELAA